MIIREVPADQRVDAEILAALLDLIPVHDGDRYLLMGRGAVIDKVEEARHFRDRDKAIELAKAMEFNAEAVFRERYTQVASKTLSVKASTLFRMLEEASVTGESRDEMMRRLLRPTVERAIDELASRLSEENEDLLRYSLEEWREGGQQMKEIDAEDLQEGELAVPVLRKRIPQDELPADLRKYSRYFLKNLFRLNNLHGQYEFFYPPEIIERYWEFISPDQGTFELKITPASGTLTLRLYEVSRRFGLERTDNPDYYALAEFLARDARKRCIKGCRIKVHGWTPEDDEVLEQMMLLETDADDGAPNALGCIAHDLSPEGLEEFRRLLRGLSGIRAEVLFPVSERSADEKDDLAALGFDIGIDGETGRFLLDGAEASERSMHEVVVLIGRKLLDLSRQAYRDPARFPEPNIEELDAEVHRLIAEAEEDGLTEEMAREIVAKITVLDYYEALARYSYVLSEQLVRYLESEHAVTFTMPRILLALLNRVLEESNADELILQRLEARP
ncbi:hypothetical protein AOA80_00755 [Methanomassiliicoccales archaeon RumEn M1]|jgi:hypothetical protein|nr:hypothetical protein AOA80_00755 [Methanomassiliicoccales archaeon RumEn M1]